MQEIDIKVRKEVDEATAIAKSDKELPLSGLWTDVSSNFLEPKIRNITGYNLDHISESKGKNYP